MLDFYIDIDFKLRHLRQCPAGEYVGGFAEWLHAAGYKRRPGQLALRGAAHLGHWASGYGISAERLDEDVLSAFVAHLPSCACPCVFQGHDDYHAAGARRFIEHMQRTGILPPKKAEPETVVPVIERFSDWMRQHRGVTESTLSSYIPTFGEEK